MIEKLTGEQIQLMEVVRNEWLDLLFKPSATPDHNKIKSGVKWLYKFSELKEPKVIIVESPLAAQLTINMLAKGQVGDQVRDQVWNQVGDQVRGQVWNQVGDQVWNQGWSQIRNQVGQVWGQVRNQIRNQVDQVRNQTFDQVKSQVSQVRSQVFNQVKSQVDENVRGNIEKNVWDNKELKYFDFCSYGSIEDYGWLSFYDFFERIGVDYENEAFTKFKDLVRSGIYDMIQTEEYCVVCLLPKQILRDGANRLHCTEDMAISWDDGYGQHYIHGVFFDEELWKEVINPNAKGKTILAIKNAEQRMAAIKYIGMEKFLKLADAKLLERSDRGNEKYFIENVFSIPAYFIGMTCPSTGRVYLEGVDPKFAKSHNADECQAHNMQITIKQYNNMDWEV